MIQTSEIPDFLVDAFPTANAELLALFAVATENAGLAPLDFLTIRDLLELSDYQNSESLHALLLIMFLALEEGSLCVEVSEPSLLRRLDDLLEPEQARAWAQRILGDLAAGFAELIGKGPDDGKPVVLWTENERQFLYFQKYLRHDLIFRDELEKRLGSNQAATVRERNGDLATPLPDGRGSVDLRSILQEVLTTNPIRIEGKPLQLDPWQRRALGLALLRNFAIISGGPGTGKTSIVLTLLRCLVRAGVAPDRIALAAPTGRAAQRMTDALRGGLHLLPPSWEDSPDGKIEKVSAQTLHRLLRYHPTYGTFGHHGENPVPADVVIVDEVSMVGLVLMSQLLQALAPGTRLVLLGDKDQLPSVEAGAVLAGMVPPDGQPRFSKDLVESLRRLFPTGDPELVPSPNQNEAEDYLVVLQENYRSQAHIRETALAVNLQDSAVVDRLPAASLEKMADLERQGGCWLLPLQENTATFRKDLQRWADYQFLTSVGEMGSYQDLFLRCNGEASLENTNNLDRLFQVLARSRLLTLVREGRWGCVDINRFFDQYLRPRWDRHGRGLLFAGAPVLITRNDPVRQLYNGDVGIALRGKNGSLRVVFPRPAGYESFPADALPAHEFGFALTVHKSQGSEYGQVLLVVPPTGGRRLLSKEMIYTAITRAKQLAIICSTPEVLRFAIGRRIIRESGLTIHSVRSE